MKEQFEQAHEQLEHASHGHEARHTRPAIIIAMMAASLALIEFTAKDAQSSYLTNHIAATNTWAQYEAKAVRRTLLSSEIDVLQSLPAKSDPAIDKRIADARMNEGRMRSEAGADGMEQLAEKAHHQEHIRDHEEHRAHLLEIASGGLQIAIVLASISVVVNWPMLMTAGITVGLISTIYGLLGGLSVL